MELNGILKRNYYQRDINEIKRNFEKKFLERRDLFSLIDIFIIMDSKFTIYHIRKG